MQAFCGEWDKTFRCRGKLCICCPLSAAYMMDKGIPVREAVNSFLAGSLAYDKEREIINEYLIATVGEGLKDCQDVLAREVRD